MDTSGAVNLHKKGPQPKIGDHYGGWAGRPTPVPVPFPDQGMLSFDLSALTLADFHNMRYHPQINSSLSVLTFMIHQCDWRIECENSRVREMVEENMTTIWTRLVRAMSQAFWAGFSPCVLEYENDAQGRFVVINKVKDLSPLECEVVWKKHDRVIAGRNRPYYTYDGIRQWGYGDIPAMNTFWYPVLMENGDFTGRKLLKSAFMPWYFSMLMHVYTNRYFERFGEPLPIGRAPFEDNIIDADGNTVTGKEVMEAVIMGIRNRGSVVLPSNRNEGVSVGASAYEYDIDYLESQMRGVDFERYLARLDEEMSLALFTPLLLLRNADVGSHNLGVQHTQCVHPDTPILCADMVWRDARDLKPGQEIVAFDEEATGEGRGKNARSYRTAVIEGNMLTEKPSMRLTTDIGDPIEASVDHPWLVRRNGRGLVWVETRELVVGDQIAYFGAPWEREDSRDAGWLAGIFDGEGTLAINRSNHGAEGRGIELTISQNPGPVLDKIKQLLTDRGFSFSEANPTATGYGSGRCMKLRLNGGFPEVMRFLGTIGPERLLTKAADCYEGRGLRKGYSYELATVTSIEDIGMNPISSIKTSGGTFITGGYLSHNTWLWMLNALLGDMKEYIDRFIIERLKSINFSPKAEKCEWVPRKLGKESNETIRAVVTELIRSNKAKPDLDELGVMLGMSLTEVRETSPQLPAVPAEVSGDPAVDERQRTERPRTREGTRTVGNDRAPTRTISNRIRSQVEMAFANGDRVSIAPLNRFEREVLGYEKADHIDAVLSTIEGLPPAELGSVEEVMELVGLSHGEAA
jgi:hypothetical protein